jgi:hypothetical protein
METFLMISQTQINIAMFVMDFFCNNIVDKWYMKKRYKGQNKAFKISSILAVLR